MSAGHWEAGHDREAEEQLLASMLFDEGAIDEARALLRPEDFGDPARGAMAAAIFALRASGEPADVVTLCAELDRTGMLAAAGGPGAVIGLGASFLTSANAACHAREVRRLAVARGARRFAQAVLSGGAEATPEALRAAADRLEAGGPAGGGDGLGCWGEFRDRLFERRETLATGFPKLDRVTGGLAVPSVAALGAYSTVGKTAFALNVAAAQDGPVAFFSLEMDPGKIIERLAAAELGIPYSDAQARRLSEGQAAAIREMSARMEAREFRLFHEERHVEEHMAIVARLRPRLAVGDYLQLVRTRERRESERLRIDHISQQYQAMSRRCGCAVLLLSQLSRPSGHMRARGPTMADLKESGGIECDADYALMLHREYVRDKCGKAREEDAYLLVDKNRYGRTGKIELRFDGRFQRFEEAGQAMSWVDDASPLPF